MLSRICYALNICWKLRSQLKSYLRNPKLQLSTVSLLNTQTLEQNNIEALILDFDGVLASHAELIPRPEVLVWLTELQHEFAPRKIYILSNKPTPQRHAYFTKNFPGIVFIVAKRKKPYPDGLQEILLQSGLAPTQLLLVDDRLGTGIVAAISCGIQAYWVTKPYVNLKVRPVTELFFMYIRWLEIVGCKII